jgi:hypothetical protein
VPANRFDTLSGGTRAARRPLAAFVGIASELHYHRTVMSDNYRLGTFRGDYVTRVYSVYRVVPNDRERSQPIQL